ncbi:MAG: DNA translocase FtsK 4TM domain-containing protein [candidate division Zixibacteria bacterium]|nr:DNA translocase FtsK 4TM domain-containing protein [candidate division Zixibacteria bacterium]
MAKSRRRKYLSAWRIIVGVGCTVLAMLLFVSLASHQSIDDDRVIEKVDGRLNPFELPWENKGGMLGAYSTFALRTMLGWLSVFVPLGLIFFSIRMFAVKKADTFRFHSLLLFVICLLGAMVYNLHLIGVNTESDFDPRGGGLIGQSLTELIVKLVGPVGSYIFLSGTGLVLLLVYTSIVPLLSSWVRVPGSKLAKKSYRLLAGAFNSIYTSLRFGEPPNIEDESGLDSDSIEDFDSDRQVAPNESPSEDGSEFSDELATATNKKRTVPKKTAQPVQIKSVDYTYPSVELLQPNPITESAVSVEELLATSRALKETLETFGISIDGGIEKYPGPVITRYEFKPGVGIKVNQILGLADDLALALKAKRIRIIAPIPGKAAVGIEIPNRNQQMVYLREILDSPEYKDASIRLPLALGKTTSGKPFVADLTRMPHLLVAGATGSGKSVCMNILISSLIYRFHPMQIKFVFIDPKMLELSIYSGIPHLSRAVVTKPKMAEKVLADTVVEMESRYRRLAIASVRNIEDFNRKQKNEEDKLAYIVVFVDELADLMMSSTSTKTELLITRLAQMARAVGIHLVLATQRPSVDVITGLIKANFPARISFQVSSKVDSRTIIDGNGAEKLLGNGDMLFLQAGQPEPMRIHGAYVSSEETERLVTFIKDQNINLNPEESAFPESEDDSESDIDLGDPLFREACEVVIRHKQGSVSLLQRRLGIGYQRAARLIDKLEQAGVVSVFDGSKAREVLVDKIYLESLTNSSPRKVSSETP